MKYRLLIGILGMTTQIFAALITQSFLNGEMINLAIYIIEDYDPALEINRSICLSNKKNSVLNSTSSIEKEKVTFEEKVHIPNPPHTP